MDVLSVISGAFGAVLATFGLRDMTEEPRYSVLEITEIYEVRRYDERIAAQVVLDGEERVALNEGFRLLADYIFGNNIGRTSIAMTMPVVQQTETIAMTAPVSQTKDARGRWVIQFFMPSQYTLETLPKPVKPDVQIVKVSPQIYAVHRFSGLAPEERIQEKTLHLQTALEKSSWKSAGLAMTWFYDPPWTVPFLRRNEIAMPVRK